MITCTFATLLSVMKSSLMNEIINLLLFLPWTLLTDTSPQLRYDKWSYTLWGQIFSIERNQQTILIDQQRQDNNIHQQQLMLWQHQNNIVLFKPILQIQKFSIYFLLPQIRNCFIKILRMFDMVNRIRKINGLIAGVEMRVGWSSSAHHHLFQYTTDTVITYNNYEHTLHSLLQHKLFTYTRVLAKLFTTVFLFCYS